MENDAVMKTCSTFGPVGLQLALGPGRDDEARVGDDVV